MAEKREPVSTPAEVPQARFTALDPRTQGDLEHLLAALRRIEDGTLCRDDERFDVMDVKLMQFGYLQSAVRHVLRDFGLCEPEGDGPR